MSGMSRQLLRDSLTRLKAGMVSPVTVAMHPLGQIRFPQSHKMRFAKLPMYCNTEPRLAIVRYQAIIRELTFCFLTECPINRTPIDDNSIQVFVTLLTFGITAIPFGDDQTCIFVSAIGCHPDIILI